MIQETNEIKVITGRVVSTKMDKTAVVELIRKVRHKLYHKYVKRTTKLFIHDQDNNCNVGDVVAITQCKPISKRKTWRLVKIVESNNQAV
ncbi:MAG: 30S ribosomal protein S17 [Legionellaceae bacterium]